MAPEAEAETEEGTIVRVKLERFDDFGRDDDGDLHYSVEYQATFIPDIEFEGPVLDMQRALLKALLKDSE